MGYLGGSEGVGLGQDPLVLAELDQLGLQLVPVPGHLGRKGSMCLVKNHKQCSRNHAIDTGEWVLLKP